MVKELCDWKKKLGTRSGGESRLFECLTFWHRRQILARHRAGLEWRRIVSSPGNRNLWTTGFKMDTGQRQGHCHLLKVPKKVLVEKTLKLIYLAGNYTLGSPGGHSASGLFTGGLANGGGPHHPPPHHSQHQQQNFLNGGSSLANLGLMTSSHNLPNIHNQSPTSVLSNYSLNRNLNQLNLNLVPRTNR